jgi:hypothetical protein
MDFARRTCVELSEEISEDLQYSPIHRKIPGSESRGFLQELVPYFAR